MNAEKYNDVIKENFEKAEVKMNLDQDRALQRDNNRKYLIEKTK